VVHDGLLSAIQKGLPFLGSIRGHHQLLRNRGLGFFLTIRVNDPDHGTEVNAHLTQAGNVDVENVVGKGGIHRLRTGTPR